MPKARNIDESIWDDKDIRALKRDERLLVIGMVTTLADDYGRLHADAALLRKTVFGYDDDLSVSDVEAMRDTIIRGCKNIRMYVVEGDFYIYFTKWDKWQKIRYKVPSKLPEYEEQYDVLLQTSGACDNLPQSTETYPSCAQLGRVEKGRDGLGRVEKSEGAPQSSAGARQDKPPVTTPVPKPPKQPKLPDIPIPEDFTLTEEMRQWAIDEGFAAKVDLERETRKFIKHWTIGNGAGKLKKNWKLTWENWIERAANGIRDIGSRANGSTERRRLPLSATGTDNTIPGFSHAEYYGDD